MEITLIAKDNRQKLKIKQLSTAFPHILKKIKNIKVK